MSRPAGSGRGSRRPAIAGACARTTSRGSDGRGSSARSALATSTTWVVGGTPSRSSSEIRSMWLEDARQLVRPSSSTSSSESSQARQARDVEDLLAIDAHRRPMLGRRAGPGAARRRGSARRAGTRRASRGSRRARRRRRPAGPATSPPAPTTSSSAPGWAITWTSSAMTVSVPSEQRADRGEQRQHRALVERKRSGRARPARIVRPQRPRASQPSDSQPERPSRERVGGPPLADRHRGRLAP